MTTNLLLEDWGAIQCPPVPQDGYQLHEALQNERIPVGKPVTAMEALIQAGRISDSIREDGEAEYCAWVAEADWLFVTTFNRPQTGGEVFLHFFGLDTECDVWLNGEKLAHHRSLYLPLRLSVSDRLQAENQLAVYFYSPAAAYRRYEREMPAGWQGIVPPAAMLRKPPCDLFRNYLGVTPYFSPVGFFGDVALECVERAEIRGTACSYRLNPARSAAAVHVCANLYLRPRQRADLRFTLQAPDGSVVFSQTVPSGPAAEDGLVTVSADCVLESPALWWPSGYGEQAVYLAVYELSSGGEGCGRLVRQIGFREVERVGDLLFRINGRVIRLWGANIATMGSLSHRENPGMARFLLDKAQGCHCNLLRVWGPGEPVCDDFYDEADRRGLLIWQDFYIEPSQLPDTPEYMALFTAEAERLIRRLRSHPSLLLWCGSNESLHMIDFNREEGRFGAQELLERVFPELCARLDPGRYYHVSSPCGGLYPNDPTVGDTHGSHCMMSYLPGEEYAVFVSEHIVTTPPELKSLERFVPRRDIWPEGFTSAMYYGRTSCFPPALARRTNNFAQDKLGPIERFYDATDAQSLVYQYAAAAGYAYEELISRLRRGRPASDALGPRRCNGYMAWKFNNTWPQFYCGLVDYYGESHIPYYAVRRAFRPLLLCFEVGDHIALWGVNDTARDVAGTLTVSLFRISENRVIDSFTCPAAVLSGESSVLTSLDRFGYFRRDCILHATLQRDGEVLARAVGTVDMERHLPFPQARLTLAVQGDELVVSTDSFARCVELSGLSDEGDAFGWHFEDNYFDLLPFETRRVGIGGKHKRGRIQAKAHYSQYTAEIRWQEGENA